MQYFCWWLAQVPQRDERPVIDMTGLQKNYDFTLSPALPPGVLKENLPTGFLVCPSIFGAVKEQLGAKLQAQKGPVEDYVIDNAEKPAGNSTPSDRRVWSLLPDRVVLDDDDNV